MQRRRIDLLLVERGLFDSRAKAQAAIAAGLVGADGVIVAKASQVVDTGARIDARPAFPYVSRGGVKLAAALDASGLDVAGRIALDVGASTGGFTEVLLARGARRVYAVEVGHGQLHDSLRHHPAVQSLEGTDIRKLDALAERPGLIVVDASFISLKHVLPAALALAAPDVDVLALIKPQFEAGRADIKKGIVRDATVHAAVCADIAEFVRGLGCTVTLQIPSPILGGDGNREFFIGAHRKA